jgi:hypothetical protein
LTLFAASLVLAVGNHVDGRLTIENEQAAIHFDWMGGGSLIIMFNVAVQIQLYALRCFTNSIYLAVTLSRFLALLVEKPQHKAIA